MHNILAARKKPKKDNENEQNIKTEWSFVILKLTNYLLPSYELR